MKKNLKHFRVDLNPIGIGWWFGSRVYRAYDPIKKRKVAIKECEHLESARQEALVMRNYGRTKYLPRFYDFFIINNKAYIVMEYVSGKPFGNYFSDSQGKKREERLCVQITKNILKGLHHLHRSGFVHRDVMPKNVMIMHELPNTVKVIDFNLAKTIKKRDTNAIQIDLHGAAKMCIFLINGSLQEPVYKSKVRNKLLQKRIMKAFNENKKDRYNSAKEFINALKPFA